MEERAVASPIACPDAHWGDGSTGCFKNAANAKASAGPYNAKATGATVMMASSIVFELLGKMLWTEDMSQDENYRQFARNMHLAPSGVSLDPSFSAAFESDAPDCFASKADALEYCARFLASELVEFWGIPAGQALVDQLETLSRKGSREGILPAIRRFDDALTLLALRANPTHPEPGQFDAASHIPWQDYVYHQ